MRSARIVLKEFLSVTGVADKSVSMNCCNRSIHKRVMLVMVMPSDHSTSMEADGDLGGCIMFAGARVVADKGIDRCRHACQSSLLLNKVQSTQLYYTPKSKDPVLRRGMARTSVSLRLRSVPCEHPRLPHPCLHRLTCHCLAALDHQVQSTRRRDGQLKSHSDVRLSRRSGTITSPCTVTR